MTLLAKRYQKNPQGGFPTFQMDVQMQSSIINHVAKGFYFFEKGSYFLTMRDSYFLTMLLCLTIRIFLVLEPESEPERGTR